MTEKELDDLYEKEQWLFSQIERYTDLIIKSKKAIPFASSWIGPENSPEFKDFQNIASQLITDFSRVLNTTMKMYLETREDIMKEVDQDD